MKRHVALLKDDFIWAVDIPTINMNNQRKLINVKTA